jgi:hypothetical protein
MPDSKLRELADLATKALTKFNAKEPSRLDKTKDVVALMTSLLALATAIIAGTGWLLQTERTYVAQREANAAQRGASAAQRQTNTAQVTATAGLGTATTEVNGVVDALKSAPPQDAKGAIENAINSLNSIRQTLTNTQSKVVPPWQVVIGDYADWDEALRKQDAAEKVGYSNSEIFGQPPHLHMRFGFSTESDAKIAADKLKAARVSHEPDVVHRPQS